MYGAEKSLSTLVSFVWSLAFFFCILCPALDADSLSSDGATLLAIKAAIRCDPMEFLSDWKDDGTDPCMWKGVGCDSSERVVSLNITSGALHSGGGALVNSNLCVPVLWRSLPSNKDEGFSCQQSENNCVPQGVQNSTGKRLSSSSSGSATSSCRLAGLLAPAIGSLTQLRILSLPFNSFYGRIPKEIATLTFLEVLDLRGNLFSGSVPAELGQLSYLKTLNLAFNFLGGTLPQELLGCHKLRVINLAGNKLLGSIPSFLGSLPYLQVLALSSNGFTGTIPSELTKSCHNLEHIYLEDNLLSGIIPGFGKCSALKSIVLSSNYLVGPIPEDLGQLRLLEVLDVSKNGLSGDIPLQLSNCSQLSVLVLTDSTHTHTCTRHLMVELTNSVGQYDKDERNFFSTLPSAILALTKLKILWAPRAALSGSLPSTWGSCENLQVLNLAGNSLSGNISEGFANCLQLLYVDLSSNKLSGWIPQLLPIQCMVVFNVSGNFLTGGLPVGSGTDCPVTAMLDPQVTSKPAALLSDDFSLRTIQPYFIKLYCGTVASRLPHRFATLHIIHDMSMNNISGPFFVPKLGESLMRRNPSYELLISDNKLAGFLPSSFFDMCPSLQTLYIRLSRNNFSGVLPLGAMANCASLRHLEAAQNQFNGQLTNTLGKLNNLVYLNLGMNNVTGKIPSQIGELQNLQYLVLANNCLTGSIPESLVRLTSLLVLDLSGNRFEGKVPSKLLNFRQLPKETRLLSGSIAVNSLLGPAAHIRNLESVCTSVRSPGNQFMVSCSASAPSPSMHQDGPLPHATQIVEKRSHHPNSIVVAAITSGCVIAAVLLILVLLFQYTKQDKPPVRSRCQLGRKQVVTFRSVGILLTYDSIVAATGNFTVNNLIGNGGFGATYKAELIPGLLVAVKRLSLGRFQGTQQFEAEIRTLGRIQHPKLVTLIGYHASELQMFLIYNYLPGGNLENLLHDERRGCISWRIRYRIALDIAEALAYLHDECSPRVLHRDIKPSNVLLDNDLNAFLSDFGLARLLGASETHATTDVAGTFGYVAPEYAMTCRVSDKADVYSYGVVLLELISGKRALDSSFSEYGHGFNIVSWACQLWQIGKLKEVFACELWEQGPHCELLDVLKLALKCTVASLSVRPTMKQVVDLLKSVR